MATQARNQPRVRIEHVHSRVKRCRLVKDRSRLWKQGVCELVMERCCALHNYRVHVTPWQPMVESTYTQSLKITQPWRPCVYSNSVHQTTATCVAVRKFWDGMRRGSPRRILTTPMGMTKHRSHGGKDAATTSTASAASALSSAPRRGGW